MSMLEEALYYVNVKKWWVFPCREKPGEPFQRNDETITPQEKTPYIAKGLDNATLDEDQVVAWWNKWPNAMIGINAGKSGLFVIDIDRKHVNGLDTFSEWNINDSAGLHSITPSGGMHILFTGTGKSSTNAKTGIDTRGEGGYFIAPPSQIVQGEYAGSYKRFDDWGRTPGVIPDGLMAKLFPDKTTEYVRGNNSGAVDGEKKQLSRPTLLFLANGAPAGERNATLFKALADFAGCGYTQLQAKDAVLPVSTRIGLSTSEFEQVLNHAYSKPRTSSIPDSIQEKIMEGGKNIASKITVEEQTVMESVLLACLLIDNTLIPSVNDILNFDDFQTFQNRIIYKAINRTFNAGMKVDYISVTNEIIKETVKITLDDVTKMTNQYFINTDHVLTYASIIKEKASIRKVESLMDNKEHYIKSGNIAEIVGTIEKDLADIALYGGVKTSTVLTSKQATEMVTEQTRKLVSGEIQQLKIGFSDFDYHCGGLYSNELIVLAGRAGEGKSALLLSIISDVGIRQNKSVGFFSLEMSTHEQICRLVCQLTGIPFKNVYQGKMTEPQWKEYREAMQKIGDSKILFDDGFGMTVPEIRSKMRKLIEKDLELVGIDQLELVRGFEGMPMYIRLDNNAYAIKDLTKEFDVPIILCHQLNRGITDRKLKNPEPILSDLNQAGEKPANQVWVISHNKDEHGNIMQSKVKILKNRNGPRIEFPVVFVGERMLFSNPTSEEENRVFKDQQDDDYRVSDDDDEPTWAKRT